MSCPRPLAPGIIKVTNESDLFMPIHSGMLWGNKMTYQMLYEMFMFPKGLIHRLLNEALHFEAPKQIHYIYIYIS